MAALMDPSFDMPPLHLPDDAELFDGNFAFGSSIDNFQCGNGYVWTPEVVDESEAVIAMPQHLLDISERTWNPSWMHENAIGFTSRPRPQVAFRGSVPDVSHPIQTIAAPPSASLPASGESTPTSAPKRRKTAPNKLSASPDTSKPRSNAKHVISKIEVPAEPAPVSIRTPETTKRKKVSRDKSEGGKSTPTGTPSTTHNVLWSESEHALFEVGLGLYGRGNWVQISLHVGSRNHLQVKYHARQYFRKLETGSAQPGGVLSPSNSATPTPKGSSRSSDQDSVESDELSVGQTRNDWTGGRESFYTFAEEQGLDASAVAVNTFNAMASERHNHAFPLAVRN